MPQIINTNISSLTAQRNLNTSQTALAVSLQRLSSGLRINSAKDDAAGLAISERFTTQIRGLNQASRNASDGISLAQTAEGALAEIGNNLQRIRELAVQSRNATNSTSDRAALNAEVTQLKAEIDRVANQTSFNGTKLLDGTFLAQAFQVGADQGQTISVSGIVDANIAALGTWNGLATTTPAVAGSYTTGQLSSLDFSTAGVTGSLATSGSIVAASAFASADFSTDSVSFDVDGNTVTLDGPYTDADGVASEVLTQLEVAAAGVYAVSADATTGVLTIAKTATGAASIAPVIANFDGDVDGNGTPIADPFTGAGATSTDGADAVTAVTTSNLVFDVDGTPVTLNQDYTGDLVGLVADIQAAVGNSYVVAADGAAGFSITSVTAGAATPVTVDNFQTTSITGASGGAAVAGADAVTTPGAANTGFANLTVATVDGADNAILAMDGALTALNSARADLGAIQNRFSSVIANLQTTSENLSASRSRIQDADFAQETAALTRAQILQQAGVAMLAQANALPQNVLSLLRG